MSRRKVLIRIVIKDDAGQATVCRERNQLQRGAVVYSPQDVAELGGVVLCSMRHELLWCVYAGYTPIMAMGMR